MNVGRFSAPVAVDYDGDGDQDLLFGAEDGSITYFETVAGAPVARRVAENPFDGVHANTRNAPALCDWNQDGKIDVVSGAGDGSLLYFERLEDGLLIARTGAENPSRKAASGRRFSQREECMHIDKSSTSVQVLSNFECSSCQRSIARSASDLQSS